MSEYVDLLEAKVDDLKADISPEMERDLRTALAEARERLETAVDQNKRHLNAIERIANALERWNEQTAILVGIHTELLQISRETLEVIRGESSANRQLKDNDNPTG